MRRPLKVLTAVAIPLLLVACEGQNAADTELDEAGQATEMAGSPAVDPAAVEAEVSQVRDAWTTGAERDDAAAVAALYAEDAILILPDGRVLEGRQAIQDAFATDFAQTSNTEVTSTDFESDGDIATDMGEFSQTVRTPDGQDQNVTGRYIVVLRRQEDGSWKITQQLAAVPMMMEATTSR